MPTGPTTKVLCTFLTSRGCHPKSPLPPSSHAASRNLQVLTEELKAAVVADAEDEHARLVVRTSPFAGLTAPDGTHPQLAVGGGWRRAVAHFQMEVQVTGPKSAVLAALLQWVGQSTHGDPEKGAGEGSKGPVP